MFLSVTTGHQDGGTYDYPHHGKPHRLPRSESIACYKGDDGSGETAQIVYRHDYPQDSGAGVVHNLEEVVVAHDAGQDALVVAWNGVIPEIS